jgi:hypothetical protein
MIGRLIAVLSVVLVLAGCQAAPAPRDFDSSRDFTLYRTWSWVEPAVTYRPADDPRIQSDLTTQRIREAISGQLDARGLRPAQDGSQGDLLVRAYMLIDQRQDNVTTHYGHSPRWGVWAMDPLISETRSVHYQVATLQIDLLDGRDGQLVWRGNTSDIVRDRQLTPAERSGNVFAMVRQILEGYPP